VVVKSALVDFVDCGGVYFSRPSRKQCPKPIIRDHEFINNNGGHGMTKQPLTRNLAEVLESLGRTLEAKAKKEKEAAAPDQPQNTKVQAKVVRLPYWNNRGRGTPNCFELKSDKRYLVRNLIYPVPNPDFPFLGVHSPA
jgi:hypothetical protein